MGLLVAFLVRLMVSRRDHANRLFVLMIAVIVSQMATGVWVCFNVRCPNCGAKLLWVAIRKQSIGSWMPWLLRQTSCPLCSFQPESNHNIRYQQCLRRL
jgi:hypothetical protein